jgi:hypothetical protein
MRRTTLAVIGTVWAPAAVKSGIGSAQAARPGAALGGRQHSPALPERDECLLVSSAGRSGPLVSGASTSMKVRESLWCGNARVHRHLCGRSTCGRKFDLPRNAVTFVD